MSSRGRGSVTVKKGVLPNLALAGKREESGSKNGAASSSRGTRGRGRGSRGRGGGRGAGRGGHSGRDKPALIQSEGIFSEGLSGADPSRRTKEKTSDTPTFSKNSRVRPSGSEETGEDSALKESSKSSFKGWEELWESDEEGDLEELSQLLRDGFISDYKRGVKLPLVLPSQDEPQFIEVLHKSAKAELLSDNEAETADVDMKVEQKETLQDASHPVASELTNPTMVASRKAASILTKCSTETESPLFLLQLPSVVNVLSASSANPMLPNESSNINQDTTGPASLRTRELPQLPKGKTIGKLQVTRGGRVFLVVDGVRMDVSKSTPGGQQENVVLLETSARESVSGGFLSMKDREGRDAVYHLGAVKHHLTASLDWADVRPKSNRGNTGSCQMNGSSSSASSKPFVRPSAEQNKIQQELDRLEKERGQWGRAAESWANPRTVVPSVNL